MTFFANKDAMDMSIREAAEHQRIERRLRHEYLIADIKRRNHSATIMFLLATLALAALWAFVNF